MTSQRQQTAIAAGAVVGIVAALGALWWWYATAEAPKPAPKVPDPPKENVGLKAEPADDGKVRPAVYQMPKDETVGTVEL